MKVTKTVKQKAKDEMNQKIINAGQQTSDIEARAVHMRHKVLARKAENLAGSKNAGMKSAIEYERLLIMKRLDEIDEYLAGIDSESALPQTKKGES